jgi:hypothetical protein
MRGLGELKRKFGLRRKTMRALLIASIFALSLAPLAGAVREKAASASTAKVARATGTIVSVTDTSLVVSSANGKQTTYVLNSDTKIGARLRNKMNPGTKVTVRYHIVNGPRVASWVILAAGAKPLLNPQPLPPRKVPTTQ